MNRRQWPLVDRPGWYLEVGPVPDRKSAYVSVITPHEIRSLAQILGSNEAETLSACLDELAGTSDQGGEEREG